MNRAIAMLSLCVLAAGCSQQDFSRPVQNPFTGALREAPIIPNKSAIPEEVRDELRMERLMESAQSLIGTSKSE